MSSQQVEPAGQLENVQLLEGPEDVVHVIASLPSHEVEEDNSILQPSTSNSGSVQEPQIKVQESQSKGVYIPAQGPVSRSDYLLSVNVIDNVRIPSFSELEILAQAKSDGNHCYMLESNLQNSDLLVARAIVTPGETVPCAC